MLALCRRGLSHSNYVTTKLKVHITAMKSISLHVLSARMQLGVVLPSLDVVRVVISELRLSQHMEERSK